MEDKETCFTLPINPNHFPSKLWRLVNNPQICSICWDSSGEKILIYQEPFEEEVLGSPNEQTREYFQTTSIISFFRQLNLYGFKKVRPDHDSSEKQQLGKAFTLAQRHHFYNKYFRRANPELLVKLQRLTPGNKAKIAAGIKVTSKSAKCFFSQTVYSPKENSAKMKNDSVLVEETPHNHHGDGSQNCHNLSQTSEPSQASVMCHGNPGSGFHHFPMNSHQSSCRHIHEGSPSLMPAGTFIPPPSHYGFYTPGYHSCSPGSLNSNMNFSQHPAASNVYYEYYPYSSFGHHHYTGQNPNGQAGEYENRNWQAGYQGAWATGVDSNMNFSQHPAASNVYCGYYPYSSFGHHHYTGQNPTWQAGESADLGESDIILESLLKLTEELQDDDSSGLLAT